MDECLCLKRKTHYYIYKIIFLKGLPENRYYYGKRTFYGFTIEKDNYTGSGNFCFAYFKKYGTILGETYLKEIIEVNNSQQENLDREAFWIGDLWKTDPLCMNQCPGGKGSADHDTNCWVQDKYKKDIAQYDLYGNFIQVWHGIRECARELNINRTGISSCLRGNKPSAFGYQWKYFNGSEEPIEPFFKIEPIVQYTKDGEIVSEYESPSDAEHITNICAGSIRQVCQGLRITAGDYIWRFKNDPFDKYRVELKPREQYKKRSKQIHIIMRFSIDGVYIDEFDCVKDAALAMGHTSTRLITSVAQGDGKHKTAYGYIWKFKDSAELTPEEINIDKITE